MWCGMALVVFIIQKVVLLNCLNESFNGAPAIICSDYAFLLFNVKFELFISFLIHFLPAGGRAYKMKLKIIMFIIIFCIYNRFLIFIIF